MTLPHDFSKLQSEMSARVKAHWKAFQCAFTLALMSACSLLKS